MIAYLLAALAQPALMQTVEAVQAEVNARVTYMAEPAGRDVWVPAKDVGDCEDYALAKGLELVARGVDAKLLDVVVANGANGGHVALAVIVDGKAMMLDNALERVVPFDEWVVLHGITETCIARDLRPIDRLASERC